LQILLFADLAKADSNISAQLSIKALKSFVLIFATGWFS